MRLWAYFFMGFCLWNRIFTPMDRIRLIMDCILHSPDRIPPVMDRIFRYVNRNTRKTPYETRPEVGFRAGSSGFQNLFDSRDVILVKDFVVFTIVLQFLKARIDLLQQLVIFSF